MRKLENTESAVPSFTEQCAVLGVDVQQSGWPDRFGKNLFAFMAERDNNRPVRVLSLFSGAGGLDIGFRDVGFDIVESVEIEAGFCQTLEANSGAGKYFADTKVNCIDICGYDPDITGIDFIIGGPPCQTFSAAGRRANGVLGTSDARGVLFREYARLLAKLSPVGFLFENVYGIVGAEGGRPWAEIQQTFSALGYKLHYRVLDTADYGVPQHRERLVIVGLREGDYCFPRPLFGPDSTAGQGFYAAATAIATAPQGPADIPPRIGGRYGDLIPAIPPGLNYSYYTAEMGNPQAVFAWRSKFSDFMYKADPHAPVRTIKAQGGLYTGPFHWDNRHFSIAEYKRLQTFPDAYQLRGGRGAVIKQIGNSVPPQFARVLALSVREQVFQASVPVVLHYLPEDEELTFRTRKRLLTEQYRRVAQASLQSKASRTDGAARDRQRVYRAGLDKETFDYDLHGSAYRVAVSQMDSLRVTVEDGADEVGVAFVVQPAEGRDWALPVTHIEAAASGRDLFVLTALWKAVEEEIRHGGYKADLTQLSNYYQYDSLVRITPDFSRVGDLEGPLTRVTDGGATRTMMGTAALAQVLGVEPGRVKTVAKRLRSLGYEVRNWNTNPRIPKGQWLIPYEFPTLNPLSVQLRKSV